MSNEECEKVLKELQEARPEMLTGEAKRLFEAIMTIADERDVAESDLYEANNRITDLLLILGDKDRMIDLMATWINEHEDPFEDCHENNISCADIECKDCIIKYFEERCK